MLSCCNLNVTVESNELFKGLGFTLFPGSILIVKGKNGVGKSTLLKVIATLHNNFSGQLLFNQVDTQTALDEYKQLIHFMSHKTALFHELTVYENLALWANLNNREESITAAAAVFELGDYLHEKVHTLSQGWQKKVSLTRPLLTNAKVWLFDEPFANLDNDSIQRLKDMITAKSQQNGIIIITSQQPVTIAYSQQIDLKDYCYE